MQGPLETVPLQGTLEPEQCGPGSTHCLRLWQTQCGPFTASTPHTCQWYFLAVSLPFHSTTEQVSMNKRPPSRSHLRLEIRPWRDLQTEGSKINKEGEPPPEVKCATDWKAAVNAETALKGQYRPWEEVEARIRDDLTLNWPTLPTTSPEKFLYIFLLLLLFN